MIGRLWVSRSLRHGGPCHEELWIASSGQVTIIPSSNSTANQTMTKLLRNLLVILFVAILGVLVWKAASPVEPKYQGKRLTLWLEGHVPTTSANPPFNSPEWKKADEALRHIGTNAIPTLLRMIRANDSVLKLKLLELARKQRLIGIHYRFAQTRNEEAEYAFRVLGAEAGDAVPGLIKIYEENVSPSSQMVAALALGSIGPPAKAAIPALLRNFTHTNADVRFYAVSAIYGIGDEPDSVVPALRSVLKDPKVQWNAVGALGNFGARARSAVPDLLEALEDPAKLGKYTLREQVEIALWRIAPEKIAKTLVVEESTPMVAKGLTTEALDVIYKGERMTLMRPGTPVPSAIVACWSSEPRGLLSLYRGTNHTTAKDHFLGRFEVMGLPPPPTSINAQVVCVIANQQIMLCARDYNREMFLEIRRVENEGTKRP